MFHLGYYRTASDATSITLADGRREMADSEFGTGTNAEKVTQKFSLFYKSDTQNRLIRRMSITHGIYVMNFHSLRRIQTVQPVLTVTAHILEYIRN